MSSTSLFADVGREPAAPKGGRFSVLDVFLAPSLRRDAPEELARYRILACIALGMMIIDVGLLIYFPRSPQPHVHGTVGGVSFVMHLLALVMLRRGPSAELPAMLVCYTIGAAFVFACLTSSSAYAASHAGGMLVPALSVYLVGARQGLRLSVLLSLFVAFIHPLRYMHDPTLPVPLGLAHLRMTDTVAALFIMVIWVVSWLHTTARERAHQAREQALRTLRESERKLHSLLENTDDPVCSLDTDGRLIIGNSAMRRSFTGLFGHEPVPGESLVASTSPFHEPLRQSIARALSGQSMRLEDSQEWGGRTHVMDISIKPMFSEEGRLLGVTLFSRDITERKEAETKLAEMHRTLMDVSRQAGMAEVATGLLHNVGNALNSVNVSAHLVIERLRTSRLAGLLRVADLLREHRTDTLAFLSRDPRGQQLPGYLVALSEQLAEEQRTLLREQGTLAAGLEHVNAIISMQQEHARPSTLEELISVPRLINDALRLNSLALERSGIVIRREFADVPPMLMDRHKLLQILLNLLSNARHALIDSGRQEGKCVTIRVAVTGEQRLRIQVSDNGKGVDPQHLGRLFTQGFTTKKNGHGFGLHISALAAMEMAGGLSCESAGVDQGATFTIDLPLRTEEPRA